MGERKEALPHTLSPSLSVFPRDFLLVVDLSTSYGRNEISKKSLDGDDKGLGLGLGTILCSFGMEEMG